MNIYEFLGVFIGGGGLFGLIGYGLGRERLLAEMLWTRCCFSGSPPQKYKDWREFAASRTKEGVFIRAATKEDFR